MQRCKQFRILLETKITSSIKGETKEEQHRRHRITQKPTTEQHSDAPHSSLVGQLKQLYSFKSSTVIDLAFRSYYNNITLLKYLIGR
jgi:hypothetical protein